MGCMGMPYAILIEVGAIEGEMWQAGEDCEAQTGGLGSSQFPSTSVSEEGDRNLAHPRKSPSQEQMKPGLSRQEV